MPVVLLRSFSMKVIIVILCALSVQLVVGEVCPGRGSCPSKMTCCELPSGREGCCPYENATCCSDKVHCCPHGYDCLNSYCKKRGEDTVAGLSDVMDNEQKHMNASGSSIVCPDYSQCADTETCCSIGDDQYGCCPMSAAVCCSDLRTCCPHGYTCNGQGGCALDEKLIKGVKISAKSVVCPGGRYRCPDYNTCCRTQSGQYACCPIYHGVCCRDGRHCCPQGYTCDAYSEHCNPN